MAEFIPFNRRYATLPTGFEDSITCWTIFSPTGLGEGGISTEIGVNLVAIMDWYSRYVVSWEVSNSLEALRISLPPEKKFIIKDSNI